jgi:hypothetical protein
MKKGGLSTLFPPSFHIREVNKFYLKLFALGNILYPELQKALQAAAK